MALLDVENLSVTLNTARGPARVLRDVSFSLEAGGTLGLIGESGSGKSMTALALLGLLPEGAAVTGSVRFKGAELTALDDDALCALRGDRIGIIFQEPMSALNPLHTIARQIAEPMLLHQRLTPRAAREKSIGLLDRVGVAAASARADAFPHQLSGGQRQRVTIAMALACDPDLLIADEPTTALDVTIQGQILDLLAGLVEERGMAMILISHDLGVIAENARAMMVMYGGAIVESGPTDTLFAHLAHPYAQGLFAARPKLGGGRGARLTTMAGSVPDLADLPGGCAFSNRCPLVIDACGAAFPAPVTIGADHTARCIRTAEAMQ